MIEMLIIEEENVLLESKDFMFVFSRDYLNEGLYIDIFDKKEKELIVKDFEVESPLHKKVIMEQINKKPGTLIRKGKMKFLVRNHDKTVWSENGYRGGVASNHSSADNIYDTRHNTPVPVLSRIIPFLKELWLNV